MTDQMASATKPVGRNPSWLIAVGVLAIVAAASLLSLSVASMIIDDVGGSVRSALMGGLLGAAGVVTVVVARRRRVRWLQQRAAAQR